MSRIDDLIQELCPEGVSFQPLGTLGRRNKGTAMTAARMREIDSGGPIRVFAGGNTVADVDETSVPVKAVVRQPSIIVKSRGHIGFTYYEGPFSHKSELWSYTLSDPVVNQKFVYYYLLTRTRDLQDLARATSVKLPQLSVRDTDALKVPVPPLAVQDEIVRILDSFSALTAGLEAELEARRTQYAHYREQLLSVAKDEDVAVPPLENLVTFINGKPHEKLVDPSGDMPLLTSRFVSTQGAAVRYIRSVDVLTPALANDVALVMSDLPNGRALARAFYVDASGKYATNQRVCLLRVKELEVLDPRYLFYVIDRNPQLLRYDSGFDQTHLKKGQILNVKVPLPPLEVQKKVAASLDKFDALVYDLTCGLPAEIEARRKQYEYYRDRLLRFEEVSA